MFLKSKFQETKFTIRIIDDNDFNNYFNKEVEGFVYGPLGINKEESDNPKHWVITHLKTGANIRPYGANKKLSKVKENVVKLVESDINWNFSNVSEALQLNPDFALRIRKVLGE